MLEIYELDSDCETIVGHWKRKSIEELSFSWNFIESDWIPGTLLKLFSNSRTLDLSGNEISSLEMLDEMDL